MSKAIPPGKGQGGKGSQDSTGGVVSVEPSDTPHVSDDELTAAAEAVFEAALDKAKSERDFAESSYGFYDPRRVNRPDFPSDEEIQEQLEWIPGRFEPYLTPDSRDVEYLVNEMGGVATVFNAPGNELVDADLSTAYGIVEERATGWEGAAGENFATYVASLPAIMANHGRVANMLQIEAQKMVELYKTRRKSAKDIADQTVQAIEAINDSNGAFLEALLAVVIVGGTMVGLGGGGLAIAGAAVASGATMGGPFLPEEKEPLPLGADTVAEVLDNMKKALDELDISLDEQEDILIDAMQYNESVIRPEISDEFGRETLLLPMRPELAGADITSIKSRFIQFTDGDDDNGSGDQTEPLTRNLSQGQRVSG